MKRLILLLLLIATTTTCEAQGVRHVNIALGTVTLAGSSGFAGPVMRPIAGAQVTVCTGSVLPASGQVCSGLASIYVDIGLTGLLSNPTTADQGGNYSFYAVGGVPYVVSVSAPGFGASSYVWSAPLSSTGSISNATNLVGPGSITGTFTGSPTLTALSVTGATALGPGAATVTGTLTATGPNNTFLAKTLEKTIYADQFTGGDWGAQVNAAATSLCPAGGIVDATGFTLGATFTMTTAPLAGVNCPITLKTGNYTVQWDPTTVLFDLPVNFHLIGDQTTFLNTNPSGGALLPDPLMQARYFIGSRLYKTTGSITTGTASLTVASTTGIQVNTRIGVWGGTTSNANQQTTINQGGGIGTGDTSFTVTSTSGWDLTRAGDLILLEIQTELITCTGGTGTTFTGCSRGVFGTTAATHANTTAVTHAGLFFAQVLSIAGSVLTLDTNASRTVSNATVWAGSDSVQIEGKMIVDGAQSQSGTDQSMPCILAPQATNMRVGQGVRLRRCEHGGFFVYGGMLNDFAGSVESTGKPPQQLGADVWAFGSAVKNNYHPASQINGDMGAIFDDRTGNVDPWSGSSNGNTYTGGALENYTFCFIIEGGSSDNQIRAAKCKATLATATGIFIDSAQWTSSPQPFPSNNTVDVGTIDATGQTAIKTTFYTSNTSNNKISVGMIQGGTITTGNAGDTVIFRDTAGYHVVGSAQSTALPTISTSGASLIADGNPTMGSGTFKGYAVLGVCRGFNDAAGDKCYGGWFKATAPNNTSTEVGLHVESADSGGRIYEFGTTAANKEILNGDGAHWFLEQASAPAAAVNVDACYADSTLHALKCSYNNGTFFQISQVITATSAAFATATAAATCVQNTTAVAGAATTMAVSVSPVSTPGVGAVWSAFVSSAGNVTINECAVAASAGGTIAFNIRVIP